jgi:hypothetical protein
VPSLPPHQKTAESRVPRSDGFGGPLTDRLAARWKETMAQGALSDLAASDRNLGHVRFLIDPSRVALYLLRESMVRPF